MPRKRERGANCKNNKQPTLNPSSNLLLETGQKTKSISTLGVFHNNKLGFPKKSMTLNRSYLSLKVKILKEQTKAILKIPSSSSSYLPRNLNDLGPDTKKQHPHSKIVPLSSTNDKLKSKTCFQLFIRKKYQNERQLPFKKNICKHKLKSSDDFIYKLSSFPSKQCRQAITPWEHDTTEGSQLNGVINQH